MIVVDSRIFSLVVFSPRSPALTAFPFSTTMHSLPPVREGQRRTGNIKLVQNRDESCQKVTTKYKLVAKGAKGHRAKEGRLGGSLLVGQVRQRIQLPAARCSRTPISARATLPPGNRPQSVTFKQPFVPNPSAASEP